MNGRDGASERVEVPGLLGSGDGGMGGGGGGGGGLVEYREPSKLK